MMTLMIMPRGMDPPSVSQSLKADKGIPEALHTGLDSAILVRCLEMLVRLWSSQALEVCFAYLCYKRTKWVRRDSPYPYGVGVHRPGIRHHNGVVRITILRGILPLAREA